ncbi:MAG: (Fe-S)-binding protein [Vicingaceae bacterium]
MSLNVKTMAEFTAEGKKPDVLFWVGCAGSYDDRAKKISSAFAKILNHLEISFGILGSEESCSGDPAKRAGNEFLFQMQAMTNIAVMNEYGVKKVVTACPHCFNIIKNEYPQLGGNYDVLHHSQFLSELMASGRLKVDGKVLGDKKITFHDPCYLGRGNDEYDAPRELIDGLTNDLVEMKRSRRNSLCCGAGGAQMFKEAEKGDKEVNMERMEDVMEVGPDITAVGCPFCMTMLTDGVKMNEKEIEVLDLAELVAKACKLD